MMARSAIWIQEECQVNILPLAAATIIHFRIAARKETWKPFPSLFFCSHQSKPRTQPLDYHRSSFLFCFSARVPIQSIFISPSVPFTAAFISTRSLNLPQPLFYTPRSLFYQLSDKLCLTSSTCLSSFSLFLSTFSPLFPSDCSLSRLFPLFIGIFSVSLCLSLSQQALSSTLSNALSLSFCVHSQQSPLRTN